MLRRSLAASNTVIALAKKIGLDGWTRDCFRDENASEDHVDAMIADGLDGLEVWHRGNPPEQRERLLTIVARHDLLVTGGSDWHGKGKPNGLGENLTDDDTVREILHRGVDLIGRVGSSHAA